jgi:hypothetical protein
MPVAEGALPAVQVGGIGGNGDVDEGKGERERRRGRIIQERIRAKAKQISGKHGR